MDQAVQQLLDRAEISDVLSRYFRALDLKDWQGLRDTLGETLELDFEQLFGDPPAVMPSDDFAAFARNVMAGFEHTQHQSGERIIEVAGDHGTCSANMIAWHTVPTPSRLEDEYLLRGRYDGRFERTADGWRMTALAMTVYDEHGDKRLYEVAAARHKE